MSCAAPDPRPPQRSVPFSPRAFVRVSFIAVHHFFLSRHHHPTWTPPDSTTIADPRIPTGQKEAHPHSGLPSRTSPPTRSKLLHLLCRRKVLSPIANPSSQPTPFQHVTSAVTTAYDLRV